MEPISPAEQAAPASEDASSPTSAESRLQEALTSKALTWASMLDGRAKIDGKPVDLKTEMELFKLTSDHLAKLRKSRGADDDESRNVLPPGIDALKTLMEGTAEKAIRSVMPDLIEENRILVAPEFRRQGGRPSNDEVRRRERLKQSGIQVVAPHKVKNKPASDDADLQKLLRGSLRGSPKEKSQ